MDHIPHATRYLIDSLFVRHPACVGVVIASDDGMVIDSRLPATVDGPSVAAMLAGWSTVMSRHSQQAPDAGVMRLTTGQIVMTRLPDGNVLGLLLEHTAPTGDVLLSLIDHRAKSA